MTASLRRAERQPRCALPHASQNRARLSASACLPDIYEQPSPGWGELILDRLVQLGHRSRLEPMKDAARTVMRHRDGILRWFTSKIANGLIEGINSLVQAAKAKARGYRSTRNLKAITYLMPANSTSGYHVK